MNCVAAVTSCRQLLACPFPAMCESGNRCSSHSAGSVSSLHSAAEASCQQLIIMHATCVSRTIFTYQPSRSLTIFKSWYSNAGISRHVHRRLQATAHAPWPHGSYTMMTAIVKLAVADVACDVVSAARVAMHPVIHAFKAITAICRLREQGHRSDTHRYSPPVTSAGRVTLLVIVCAVSGWNTMVAASTNTLSP